MFNKILVLIWIFGLVVSGQVNAATRLVYENFDDQKLTDSQLQPRGRYVSGEWEVLVPPKYNLEAVGREGGGHSFSSGTENGAWLRWLENVPDPWPSDEMYASIWLRYPSFTSTDSNENFKFFYPHWNGTSSYVHYSLTGANTTYYSAMGNGTMLQTNRYMTIPGATDGGWHHYEFWIKFSTAEHKFWYDGELLLDVDYADGSWSPNRMYYVAMPSIDAEEVGVFSRQVDDWEVWDGMPSPDPAPGDVTNFNAQPEDGQIVLSWINPTDSDFEGTMVRYSTGDDPFPPTHEDGVLVCDRKEAPGAEDGCTATGLTNGVKYNFSAFTYNQAGNYSHTAHISATPQDEGSGGEVISWSATEQAGSSSWSDSSSYWTVRALVKGDSITAAVGNSVKVGFRGRASGDYSVGKISIAERDTGGAEGDVVDSTWTKVVFDNNSQAGWASDEMTVAAGTEKFTDPVTFDFDPGKDYYITFHLPDPSVYLVAPSDYSEMYFEGADREAHAEDIDWAGNGHSVRIERIHAVSSIYIVNSGTEPLFPPDPPADFQMEASQ